MAKYRKVLFGEFFRELSRNWVSCRSGYVIIVTLDTGIIQMHSQQLYITNMLQSTTKLRVINIILWHITQDES